jgi:hypothetical protein
VAHRPGPHALPPTHQGRRRAPHPTRPIQARHLALPQALHRPRDRPPPHQPATDSLPERGGITNLTSTDTTKRNTRHASPVSRPVESLVELATGPGCCSSWS